MMTRIARALLAACLCLTVVTLAACEDDPEDGLHRQGMSTPTPTPDAGTPSGN